MDDETWTRGLAAVGAVAVLLLVVVGLTLLIGDFLLAGLVTAIVAAAGVAYRNR